MRAHPGFSSIAILIGFGAVAQAETVKFAAGPAYSTHNAGGTVACRVFNNGTTNATITSRKIFTNTNSLVTKDVDNCNAVLLPNKQCTYAGAVPGNFAFTCAIVVTGTTVSITGSMDIISSDPGLNLLTTAPFLSGR
jgi:hypothetical protein